MYDPRWDDPRERDDGRARVYDERDRADHDPRDGLMHDLDLPRGEAREFVVDRDHLYELNGEDSAHWRQSARSASCPSATSKVTEAICLTNTIDHLRDEGQVASDWRAAEQSALRWHRGRARVRRPREAW